MQTLRVLANPYTFVHPEHGPQGTLPTEDNHTPGMRRWVGAKLCPHRTRITERRPERDPRGNRQVTCFVFSKNPVEVPASNYYLAALQNGDLIPGDAETKSAVKCRFETLDDAAKAVGEKHDEAKLYAAHKPKAEAKAEPKAEAAATQKGGSK